MRYMSQIKSIVFLMNLFISMIFASFILLSCANRLDSGKSELKMDTEYSYYPGGQLEFSAEYINGKLDGLSKHWSKDGNLISETQYSNGQLHGFWKKYFSNHKLSYECYFFHGQKHGNERWYHENGQMKSEHTFHYGISQNDMMRWRPDGTILY